MLAFGLLGPLRVHRDGEPLVLPRGKVGVVLALLLLNAERVVSIDQLLDALWGASPPPRAANAVQQYVSQLRKLLGADRVATTPPGYRLHLGEAELDALDFEHLVDVAGAARRRDDAAGALELLRQALALWRGPALAGFEFDEFASAGVARLEELRLVAIEDRVDLELALGAHDSLVGQLESLVTAHPLRERLRSQQMLALYRSNRQADALRAYQELRSYLGEELGIEPNRGVAALERAILVQDESLAWRTPVASMSASPVQGQSPALPPALARAELPIVGREKERSDLLRAWHAVQKVGPGLALVTGEAGIGKTRLVIELARVVSEEGGAALYGRCDHEAHTPFGPIVEALQHLVESSAIEDLRSELGQGAGDLARLLPDLRQRLGGLAEPRGDEETERYFVFQSVAQFLQRASRRAPILLVLEDLQWSDRPTLALIRHFLRTAAPAALLVVGTYRSESLEPSHPLTDFRAEVIRHQTIERIHLGGLPAAAVGKLLDAVGRGRVGARRARLHERTGGNPFFILQAVSDQGDEGADGEVVPDSVRDVALARVHRLGEVAAEVLADAAIIGEEFSADVLADVTGWSIDELLTVLDEAEDAHIIQAARASGDYRFAHRVLAEALVSETSVERRRVVHGVVGEVLEVHVRGRARPPYGDLARHFIEAATPEALEKALGYAVLAADQAWDVLAYENAADHFSDALRIMESAGIPDARHYCSLLVRVGESRAKSGALADARSVFLDAAERARRIQAPDLAAAAALGAAGPVARFVGQVDDSSIPALEEAAAHLRGVNEALRGIVLGTLATRLPPGSARARRVTAETNAAAAKIDDPDLKTAALVARFWDLYVDGTPAQRLTVADEVSALLGEQRSERRLVAHLLRMTALLELGRVREFAVELAEAEDLAEALRLPFYQALVRARTGTLALLAGNFDEAERVIRDAFDRFSNEEHGMRAFGAQVFSIRRERGTLAQFARVMDKLVDRTPDYPALALPRCLTDLEAGRVETARQEFEMLVAGNFASVQPRGDPLRVGTLALLASACTELAYREWADPIYAELLPYAGEAVVFGLAACDGAVDRSLGMLSSLAARWDDAEEHFAAALDFDSLLQAPLLVAHTRYAWAQMLLARNGRGDANRATVLLEAAREAAVASQVVLAAKVDALLRRAERGTPKE